MQLSTQAVMVVFNYPFSLIALVENIEQTFKMGNGTCVGVFSVFVAPKRALMRTLVVLGTVVVAEVVQDFGFLTAITGSLANGVIAFVLPPLFYIGMHWGSRSRDLDGAVGAEGEASRPGKLVLAANCVLALGGTAFALGSALLILAAKFGWW
jgi:hypothetical protein